MTDDDNSGNDKLSARNAKIIEILHDRTMQEQNLFWMRFIAFSALHAGLLAFVDSREAGNVPFVTLMAFLLALAWLLVQFLSLHYVKDRKEMYYSHCVRYLIPKPNPHPCFGKHLSSTNIGLAVSLVTLVIWIVIAACQVLTWIGECN